jgi:membrane protein YdbS with pleckstrin-like domain
MMKKIIYIVLILLLLLVTLFGLGPVLYADGTNTERMVTLVIVLALYAVILITFYVIRTRWKK